MGLLTEILYVIHNYGNTSRALSLYPLRQWLNTGCSNKRTVPGWTVTTPPTVTLTQAFGLTAMWYCLGRWITWRFGSESSVSIDLDFFFFFFCFFFFFFFFLSFSFFLSFLFGWWQPYISLSMNVSRHESFFRIIKREITLGHEIEIFHSTKLGHS